MVWRLLHQLRRTRTFKIAELGDACYGQIVGRVEACGPTLTAPLTGRACVFYAVEAEDDATPMRRRGQFDIVDASGRVRIEGGDASLELELALDAVKAITARELRYREAIIAAGDVVVAIGSLVREPDLEAAVHGYRDQPTRLRLTSAPGYPVSIREAPGQRRT